ncbi:MAG: FecR domain-containing protein [Candidatus Omnitrophota bacterium]
MKKVIASFAAFLLVFSVPVLFAQMPLGVPPVSGISQDLTRIGVVAAAGGKVELTTPGQVGRVAQSGQAIFMGDEVKTDALGHLQILLLDETVFTIGPNSAITIDKFVYDPASHRGEIKASITKGVFRYVSGKIAAQDPDAVKVKLPAATLGFRGTIVGGSVGANGQGLAALMGPGSNNDAGAQNGSFTIDGAGGDQQNVNRTGFGVEFGADGGLSGVFQLSDEQMNGLSGGLGGGQDNGGQGGGSQDGGDSGGGLGGNTDMGDLSGENNVLAGGNVTLIDGLGSIGDSLNNASILGAQEARNDTQGGIQNGRTKTSDLVGLSGIYAYSGSGIFYTTVSAGSPVNISGTVSASWNLNFTTQALENVSINLVSMGGGIGGSTGFATSFANVPFSSLSQSGDAIFTPPVQSGTPESRAIISFENVDGQVAQNGKIVVTYSDGPAQNVGNGGFSVSKT